MKVNQRKIMKDMKLIRFPIILAEHFNVIAFEMKDMLTQTEMNEIMMTSWPKTDILPYQEDISISIFA